jgi:hypothetical protein
MDPIALKFRANEEIDGLTGTSTVTALGDAVTRFAVGGCPQLAEWTRLDRALIRRRLGRARRDPSVHQHDAAGLADADTHLETLRRTSELVVGG